MRGTLALISLITVISISELSFAKPAAYRAVVMPYEESFLDGSQSLVDKKAELISSFYGLAPAYAGILVAKTRSLPISWQLEELFPGNRLNPIIVAEFNRFLQEELAKLKIATAVQEFVSEQHRHGIKFFVFTTTDYPLAAEDIARRKLPIKLIKITTEPTDTAYPPLQKILSRYELAADQVLVLGGSQDECNEAGLAGLDFALYHEMVEARVFGDRPCNILYKVNLLRDIRTLLRSNY